MKNNESQQQDNFEQLKDKLKENNSRIENLELEVQSLRDRVAELEYIVSHTPENIIEWEEK